MNMRRLAQLNRAGSVVPILATAAHLEEIAFICFRPLAGMGCALELAAQPLLAHGPHIRTDGSRQRIVKSLPRNGYVHQQQCEIYWAGRRQEILLRT